MNNDKTPPKTKPSKTETVAAGGTGSTLLVGGTGGTLLVILANNLPDNNSLKTWLVLIAPSFSVGLSVFLGWVRGEINGYLRRKKMKLLVDELNSKIERGVDNPHTSDEHRDKLIKEYEDWEWTEIKNLKEEIAEMRSLPTSKPESLQPKSTNDNKTQ